jgi:hypothetical protein
MLVDERHRNRPDQKSTCSINRPFPLHLTISQYYHLVAQSIRVLADSPLDPEIPKTPVLQQAQPTAKKGSTSASSQMISDAFSKFETPLKRKRT